MALSESLRKQIFDLVTANRAVLFMKGTRRVKQLSAPELKSMLDRREKEDGVDKGPKTRAGFLATTQFNRHDFGGSWNSALDQGGLVVGDDRCCDDRCRSYP